MLVNFSPNITTNKLKTPSFKANPYINTRKIASVAEAYNYEGYFRPENKRRIIMTLAESADLEATIQKCLADGQRTVAAILSRVKKNWPVVK